MSWHKEHTNKIDIGMIREWVFFPQFKISDYKTILFFIKPTKQAGWSLDGLQSSTSVSNLLLPIAALTVAKEPKRIKKKARHVLIFH